MKIPLFFLLITYYCFSLLGILLADKSLSLNLKFLSFFDHKIVESYITKKSGNLSTIEENTILFFFRRDSEILSLIADLHKKNNKTSDAAKFYKEAALHEPQHRSLYWDYLQLIKNTNSDISLNKEIYDFVLEAYPNILETNINRDDFLLIPEENFKEILEKNNTPLSYHQLFYFIGLAIRQDNPELTKKLWQLTTEIYPDPGHYHVELASLLFHDFNNLSGAMEILETCQRYKSPAEECLKHTYYPLPEPGSFAEYIKKW